MPVLVTAPGGTVGRAVVGALTRLGGEVRAFCGPDAPVGELRARGAVCAVGSLLDEGHLESAMEQVHTVVHLAVGPLADDPARVVEEAATVVSASVGAQVRRLIALSLPGARAEAGDPLRRAAAEAEQVLAAAPCPTTVVRVSLIDSPEVRGALARTPLPPAVLDTPVAPVCADDLAALVAWLDEQRAGGLADAETLAADGPVAAPLGAYLRAVGVTPMSVVGRVVGRLRGAGGQLPDVLAGPWTSGPEVDDAWSRADITPGTPLPPGDVVT